MWKVVILYCLENRNCKVSLFHNRYNSFLNVSAPELVKFVNVLPTDTEGWLFILSSSTEFLLSLLLKMQDKAENCISQGKLASWSFCVWPYGLYLQFNWLYYSGMFLRQRWAEWWWELSGTSHCSTESCSSPQDSRNLARKWHKQEKDLLSGTKHRPGCSEVSFATSPQVVVIQRPQGKLTMSIFSPALPFSFLSHRKWE